MAYPFAETGPVHALIAQFDAAKLDERFDADGARLHVRLPADRANALKERLRDATRDRVRFSDS